MQKYTTLLTQKLPHLNPLPALASCAFSALLADLYLYPSRDCLDLSSSNSHHASSTLPLDLFCQVIFSNQKPSPQLPLNFHKSSVTGNPPH